jgi:hypothetical protein
MNVLVEVRMYFGGAAQRWQRLSGNGGGSGGFGCMILQILTLPTRSVLIKVV